MFAFSANGDGRDLARNGLGEHSRHKADQGQAKAFPFHTDRRFVAGVDLEGHPLLGSTPAFELRFAWLIGSFSRDPIKVGIPGIPQVVQGLGQAGAGHLREPLERGVFLELDRQLFRQRVGGQRLARVPVMLLLAMQGPIPGPPGRTGPAAQKRGLLIAWQHPHPHALRQAGMHFLRRALAFGLFCSQRLQLFRTALLVFPYRTPGFLRPQRGRRKQHISGGRWVQHARIVSNPGEKIKLNRKHSRVIQSGVRGLFSAACRRPRFSGNDVGMDLAGNLTRQDTPMGLKQAGSSASLPPSMLGRSWTKVALPEPLGRKPRL